MDNLTHSLIGVAASKAGLEKLSPGATTLCLLAANAPDADVITGVFGGRWVYLHHHRGITHSIVGTTILALLLPCTFYLVDLLIARLRKRAPKIKLQGLVIASLVASATHPLMDWTNNYGVRFLLPWNPRWFYGDFVFIIDPVLWFLLGGAVFLVTANTRWKSVLWIPVAVVPSLLVFLGPANRGGLTNPIVMRVLWFLGLVALLIMFWRKVGPRFGVTVPRIAFVAMGVYLLGLFTLHAVALRQARLEAERLSSLNSEEVLKIAAMPTLANPTRWQCVFETQRNAYRFDLSLFDGGAFAVVRHNKPQTIKPTAMAEASQDYRTPIFLNFARFPVARLAGEDCASQTLVQFADLRYTEPGQSRGTFTLEVPVSCPN